MANLSFDDLIPQAPPDGGRSPLRITVYPKGSTPPVTFDDLIPQASAASEIGQQVATSPLRTAAGVAGALGDLPQLATRSLGWLGSKILPAPFAEGLKQGVAEGLQIRQAGPHLPGAGELIKAGESMTGLKMPEPRTVPGQFARTISDFAGTAALAPGSVLRNVSQYGVLPGAASEAAGQLAGKISPDLETPARLAAAIATPSLAGRAITPLSLSPERAALLQTLKAEGITPTAGQLAGQGPLKWAEAAAADLPFASGKARALNERIGREFTGATMRKMGATGEELATPAALQDAKAALSQKFEDLAARNTAVYDLPLVNDLKAVRQNYRDIVPENMRSEIVDKTINAIATQPNQKMAGQMYQNLRSQLEKQAQSVDFSNPPLAQSLRGIKTSLDENMGRSISTMDKAEWERVRKQWGNWKAIEKAATSAGEKAAEGYISPSALRNAVVAQGRTRYATGQGDMDALARAGEAFLKPLPQSGTGPRLSNMNLAAMPLAAASGLVGRGLLSGPVQAYFGNQLLSPVPMARGRSLIAPMLSTPDLMSY